MSRILKLALQAPELHKDDALLLPVLPIPDPGAPLTQHVVVLSAEQVDAALAFVLLCAKCGQHDDEPLFFPDLHNLKFAGTVEALLGHFLTSPRHGVMLTRARVNADHFPAMLAAASALPPVEFAPSGEAKSVRVLFADPCIGGGVLFKKGTQEEALLREVPSLIAAMPLTMRLVSGDRRSRFHRQDQEALVMAADDGPTFIAIDAARFQVLEKFSDPVDCDQFSQVWTAREAAKALAGFLGVKGREEGAAVVAVSTAAWGCGTYKGNLALKFVLQWLAAAAAGVSLVWECK